MGGSWSLNVGPPSRWVNQNQTVSGSQRPIVLASNAWRVYTGPALGLRTIAMNDAKKDWHRCCCEDG